MTTDRQATLTDLLRHAPMPVAAQAVLRELAISQPTLSRLVRQAGDTVVSIGRARATRYALSRPLARAGSRWPLYRLDDAGTAHTLGELRSLERGYWYFEPDGRLQSRRDSTFLQDDFRDGLYPGLPWFLDDQRPQGFLGRAFAHRVGPLVGASTDLKQWNTDDTVLALLQWGWDGCGDLLLGETSLAHAQRNLLQPEAVVDESDRIKRYPELAAAALRGEPLGSSADGEQPKFAITLHASAGFKPVIVKFSNRDDSAAGRRWADLLRCEHIAGEVLRAHGLPAATSEIVQADGRTFLQSTRFDRTAQLGRRGMLSLAALDAAHFGHGQIDWWRRAPQLQRSGWLDAASASQLSQLGWFGALIANTDMHLGNAALLLTDRRPLALAPAYDMLPMSYRPASNGEVLPAQPLPVPPLPTPEQRADWLVAANTALAFWQQVGQTLEISAAFRSIAGQHLGVLDQSVQLVSR